MAAGIKKRESATAPGRFSQQRLGSGGLHHWPERISFFPPIAILSQLRIGGFIVFRSNTGIEPRAV
jgi:hypothetical protein